MLDRIPREIYIMLINRNNASLNSHLLSYVISKLTSARILQICNIAIFTSP